MDLDKIKACDLLFEPLSPYQVCQTAARGIAQDHHLPLAGKYVNCYLPGCQCPLCQEKQYAHTGVWSGPVQGRWKGKGKGSSSKGGKAMNAKLSQCVQPVAQSTQFNVVPSIVKPNATNLGVVRSLPSPVPEDPPISESESASSVPLPVRARVSVSVKRRRRRLRAKARFRQHQAGEQLK